MVDSGYWIQVVGLRIRASYFLINRPAIAVTQIYPTL